MGLLASCLSSLCTALMVVSDRFVVNDYYDGNQKHAWIISSAIGAALGITLTIGLMVFFIITDTSGSQFSTSILFNHFVWEGILTFIGGICVAAMLYNYFAAYAKNVDSTALALWIASVPLFLVMVYVVLSYFGIEADTYSVGITWYVGIILATASMVAFQRVSSGEKVGGYHYHIGLYIFFGVLYSLILRYTFTQTNYPDLSPIEATSLLFFYWMGYSAALLTLFRKTTRNNFFLSWKYRIRKYIVPILILEVINMLVFYFEYMGITELNPAYVGVIIGANVFIVYAFDYYFGHKRAQAERFSQNTVTVFGFPVATHTLPEQKNDLKSIAIDILLICFAVTGIILASQHIHIQ